MPSSSPSLLPLSMLSLLLVVLQISTTHASPAILTSKHTPSHPASPFLSPSTMPHHLFLQPRDSSTSITSYSGNLLITFAPLPTTISGIPTTLSASTPISQAAVATPYPAPPAAPTSGLSIGAKATIGAGAVVVLIFLAFALCCVAVQTRQRRAGRRAAVGGEKDEVGLMDLKPMGGEAGWIGRGLGWGWGLGRGKYHVSSPAVLTVAAYRSR